MVNKILKESIKDDTGYIYGFANLKNLLEDKYSKYGYGIVIGKKLDDQIIDSIHNGPNLPYLNLYKSVNSELAKLAENIKKKLHAKNISSRVIAPTTTMDERHDEYYRTLRLDFSHKMVATRAGLGWIGKTALFVSYRFGPRIRLVSLITDHPLDYCKTPVEASECGECRLCVDRCPAGAANGRLWDVRVDRDEFYNAHKCRETCKAFFDQAPVCGICVSVCPKGKELIKNE